MRHGTYCACLVLRAATFSIGMRTAQPGRQSTEANNPPAQSHNNTLPPTTSTPTIHLAASSHTTPRMSLDKLPKTPTDEEIADQMDALLGRECQTLVERLLSLDRKLSGVVTTKELTRLATKQMQEGLRKMQVELGLQTKDPCQRYKLRDSKSCSMEFFWKCAPIYANIGVFRGFSALWRHYLTRPYFPAELLA